MTTFTPSPEQNNIDHATFNTNVNLAISALAGTGKTSTLVWIAKRLPNAESKIFCAFNADIVKDLQSKLDGTGVTARTFHSLGLGALKKYLDVKELPPKDDKYRVLVNKWAETDGVFSLTLSEALQDYEPEERGEKAQSLRKDTITLFVNLLDLIRVKLVAWDDVASMASLIAMNRLDVDVPHDGLVELVIRNVAHIMKQAEAETRKLVIDFTDMIYWAVKWNLRIYPYKWVLVDEAQDFNPLQREMIAKIIDPKGGRIILVGDINQAIYAFAGADSDSFDLSVKRWNCTVLPLNTTRRCSRIITEHASRLVPDFNCPPDKPRGKIVWIDEAEFSNHVTVGDMVVSRVTAPLVKEFLGLIAKGIPSIILGKDMSKQFIALLDKLTNRKDYTFPNLLQCLTSHESEQVDHATQKGDESLIEAIRDQCAGLRSFIEAYPNMSSIDELTKKIKDLLGDAKPKEGVVVFCTVHKSKGLEADRVFILAPDKLPLMLKDMSPEQLQQEYNLLYVAETRAKNTLVIVTNPKFLKDHSQPSYVQNDFEDKVWDKPTAPLMIEAVTPEPVAVETTPIESTETIPSFHTAMSEVLGSIGMTHVLYATNDGRKMCVSYSPKWDSFIVKNIAPDGKQSSEIVTSRNDTLQMMKEFQPQATHWQFLTLVEWEEIRLPQSAPEPVTNIPLSFATDITKLLGELNLTDKLLAEVDGILMFVSNNYIHRGTFDVRKSNISMYDTPSSLTLKEVIVEMHSFSPIASTWKVKTLMQYNQYKLYEERKAEAQSTPLVTAPLPFASIMKQHLTELLTTYDPDRGLCADGETTTMYITTNWDEEYIIYERDYASEDDMLWTRDSKDKNAESVLKKMEAINANPDAWRVVIWGSWIEGTHNESPIEEQESPAPVVEPPAVIEASTEQPITVADEPPTPLADALLVDMIAKLLRIPKSADVLKLAQAIHTASLEHLPKINRETLAGISKLQVSLTKVMLKHNYPPAPSGIYMDNVIDDIALFLVNGTLPDAQDPLPDMVAEIGGVVAESPVMEENLNDELLAKTLFIQKILQCLQHPNPMAGRTLAFAIHKASKPHLIGLDWKSRTDVATLRIDIKRVMRKYEYPPNDTTIVMNDVVDALAYLFEHGKLPDAPTPDTRTPFAIAMTPRMRELVTGSKQGLFCNADTTTLFIEIAPDESIVINEFVYADGRNPVAVVNLEPALASMESHNPNPDAWQLGDWDTWYKDARTREKELPATPSIEATQPIVSVAPVVAPVPDSTPADTTPTFSIGENSQPPQNGKDISPTPAPLPSTAPDVLKALIEHFRPFALPELDLVLQAIEYIKHEKEGVNA